MKIISLKQITIRLLQRRFFKQLKFKNSNKIQKEYLIKSYLLHNDLELIINLLQEDSLEKTVCSNLLQKDNFL